MGYERPAPCTIGSRKSSDFGYTPKNAKIDTFQQGTNTHTGQIFSQDRNLERTSIE